MQKLNASCKFLAQFGKEGSGDGEFKSPTEVVVESGIWVTDTGNNRVQKFNAATFNYASQFGEEGSGEGQFESPTGIASDFQGRLWVVDSGNDRAQKFNLDGEYLDQFGEKGSGAGQLSNPTGIAIPAPQKVLLLDTGNSRVESWTVKAEPPDVVTRPATELKAASAILNANIDPEALTTSYWFEYGTTTAYGTKVPITPESIGSGSRIARLTTNSPRNLSLSVRPALRPPPGDALRRPLARQAERGRRRRGDARDPPRPARGRRQLQGRQSLHHDAEGALPRRRGAGEPRPRPAGGQDRQRGADRADGRHRPRAGLRLQRPDRDPDGRPAGLGQDDRLRQARPLPARERQEGRRPRRLRRLPPGRGRPAGHRRRARRRPRLRARHRRRPGRDRRLGARPGQARSAATC